MMELSIDIGARVARTLPLALALSACHNPYDPRNLGSFAVDLEIAGTPIEDRENSFLWAWNDPDGTLAGSMPLSTRVLPYTFEQVPPGRTVVTLKETPSNCTTEQAEQTVNVSLDEIAEVVFVVACQ